MLVGDRAHNLSEVVEMIDKWNDKLQEDSDGWFEENGIVPFTIEYFSWGFWVKYLGMNAWDSINDDRDWDDDLDDVEALETYIVRRVDELNKYIGGVKLC